MDWDRRSSRICRWVEKQWER